MQGLLDQAADGRQKGLRAWYANSHALRCERCGRYLASLRDLASRLSRTKEESTDADALARLSEKLLK